MNSYLQLPWESLYRVNQRYHRGESLISLAKEFDFDPSQGWIYGKPRTPRKDSLENTISTFVNTALRDSFRNCWIDNCLLSIYIRRNKRHKIGQVLDIANIEVKLEYQKRGIFSSILANTISLQKKYNGIRIEQVMTPVLDNWCKSNNWEQEYRHDGVATYFLPFSSPFFSELRAKWSHRTTTEGKL